LKYISNQLHIPAYRYYYHYYSNAVPVPNKIVLPNQQIRSNMSQSSWHSSTCLQFDSNLNNMNDFKQLLALWHHVHRYGKDIRAVKYRSFCNTSSNHVSLHGAWTWSVNNFLSIS